MFFTKKLTKNEYTALKVEEWEAWVGEKDKGDWTLEEDEVFYVTDGEVFITVDDQVYHLTPGSVASLKKGLICEWNCPNFVKKNFVLNKAVPL